MWLRRSHGPFVPKGRQESPAWLCAQQEEVDFLVNFCSTSLVAQIVKSLPTMRETLVRSLGRKEPLEKEMATHSSILAQKTLWMEEPGGLGGLQSMTSQRVGHNWVTNTSVQCKTSSTKMGRPTTDWRMIFSVYIIQDSYQKGTFESITKGQTTQSKNWQRIWTDQIHRKIYKQSTKIWKNTPCCY